MKARAALVATMLVGCGAAAPASTAPSPAQTSAPGPAAAAVAGACEPSPWVELLDGEREPILVLGRGSVRLAVHASGDVESSPATDTRLVAMADVGDRGWLFVDADAVVWRSASFVGPLERVAELPRAPADPPAWLARFVQRGALGVVLRGEEGLPGEVVRIDADGVITTLAVPPSDAIAFGAHDRAALALVGGGLGWLEGDAHHAIVLDGGAAPLAGLAPRADGIVAWTREGRAFLDGVRALETAPRPCGRAALATERTAEEIARQEAATPTLTAGTRDYFLAPDGVTVRARERDGSASLGPAVLPSADCVLVPMQAGVFATCPSESSDEPDSDAEEPDERLLFLDPSFSFAEVARGEIQDARDDATIRLRRRVGAHDEVCLAGPTGRLSCVERARWRDGEEQPEGDVVGCGARGGAIRYRGSVAVTAVLFDLVTGAETEAAVPSARRRDEWRVDCRDEGEIELVSSSDAGTHRYRIVVGGLRPVLFEELTPRVIHLDAFACCFGGPAYRCVEGAARGPAEVSVRYDDAAAIVSWPRGSLRFAPAPGDTEPPVVRTAIALGDGSIRGLVVTNGVARRFIGRADGSLDPAEMPLGRAVAVLGDEVVEDTRSGADTVLTRFDRQTGLARGTRLFAGAGALATWDGELGVVVDATAFVPFDARAEPRTVTPPPEPAPQAACATPPPCAPDHLVRGPLVFGESAALVGIDSAATSVVEQAGAESCVASLVVPTGEALALRDRTFVGAAAVGARVVELSCTEADEALAAGL